MVAVVRDVGCPDGQRSEGAGISRSPPPHTTPHLRNARAVAILRAPSPRGGCLIAAGHPSPAAACCPSADCRHPCPLSSCTCTHPTPVPPHPARPACRPPWLCDAPPRPATFPPRPPSKPFPPHPPPAAMAFVSSFAGVSVTSAAAAQTGGVARMTATPPPPPPGCLYPRTVAAVAPVGRRGRGGGGGPVVLCPRSRAG